MNQNKGFAPLIVIAIVGAAVIIAAGASYVLIKNTADVPEVSETPEDPKDSFLAGCTKEAKICPDGTTVGRTGPDCEFAECPHAEQGEGIIFGREAGELCGLEPSTKCPYRMRPGCDSANKEWGCYPSKQYKDISGWKTYRNEKYGFQLKYPDTFTQAESRNGNCFSNPEGEDFCIRGYYNTKNLSLEDWQSKHSGIYLPRKENINISGNEGLLFMGGGSLPISIILLNHGSMVLEIIDTGGHSEIISGLSLFGLPPDTMPYELDIEWNSELGPVQESEEDVRFRQCFEGKSHKAGLVTNGEFAGSDLLVRLHQFCGMDCGGRSEQELNYYVFHENLDIQVGTGTEFAIRGLNYPEEITVPDSDYVLTKDFAEGFFDAEEMDSVLFSNAQTGDIYANRGCFVAERPDHAAIWYSLELPFMNEEDGQLEITLNDGAPFSDGYDYGASWNCLNLTEPGEVDSEKNISKIGENAAGEGFYTFSDKYNDVLQDLFNLDYTIAKYQNLVSTYDEFLALHPLLYWQDPFGRWVEFKNKKYLLAAEKCKPVIYLYPEEEMEVRVYVEPNGGFTHTIPEYKDGWHVTAYPDGKIVDGDTNEEYPYLYWAGWGLDIPSITKGWVVPLHEVETFLNKKLAKLGLNEQEIYDFNEYWVKRLQDSGAPYYKVMFLEQEEFNRIAPLTIDAEKNPDNIIRVIMYAQAVNKSEVLPKQILPPTPNRDGFTVVEWGGSLFE